MVRQYLKWIKILSKKHPFHRPVGSSGCSEQGLTCRVRYSEGQPGRRHISWHPGTDHCWCQRGTCPPPWRGGDDRWSSGQRSVPGSWSRTGQTQQNRTLSSANNKQGVSEKR